MHATTSREAHTNGSRGSPRRMGIIGYRMGWIPYPYLSRLTLLYTLVLITLKELGPHGGPCGDAPPRAEPHHACQPAGGGVLPEANSCHPDRHCGGALGWEQGAERDFPGGSLLQVLPLCLWLNHLRGGGILGSRGGKAGPIPRGPGMVPGGTPRVPRGLPGWEPPGANLMQRRGVP